MEKPDNLLGVAQMDLKPTLKVLAGICIFFGVMALVAACGAMVVIALKNLLHLL